jgi:16S rRNA G527 N7-methylase RsmG
VPLAIALPHLRFTLADSRRSRIAFLELALDELGLRNATVSAGRVEELPREFDVCLARGFAGPEATWTAAERLLRKGGSLVYWAGATFDRARVPEGARLAGLSEPGLESGGPIVIMARQ